MNTIVRCCVVSFAILVAGAALANDEKAPRPYRIDDNFATFTTEEIGTVAIAPGDQAVAFTRRRPANAETTNSLIIDETRDDVWLQDGSGKSVRNLTRGAADRSGWWAPRWSPDGERLAMLSSRGGMVQLWVWERSSDELRQVTRSGVDFAGDDFSWLDAQRLIYVAMPSDDPATVMGRGGYSVGKGVERAEAAWARAKRGEVTASAINSLEFRLPKRRVITTDLRTGRETVVGETECASELEGTWWRLSPDKRLVLLQRPEPSSIGLGARQRLGGPGTLELRTLDGRLLPLQRSLPASIVLDSVRWLQDGSTLAFFALEDKAVHPELLFHRGAPWVRYPEVASKEYPGRLWRVSVHTGEVEPLDTGDIDLGRGSKPLGSKTSESPEMFWTASGELLFHAPRLSKRPERDVTAEREWLLLGRDGSVKPGAESMAVAGDEGAAEAERRREFEERMPPPAKGASLVALSSSGQVGIYKADNRKGTFLWRVRAKEGAELLLAANTFRADVQMPEQRLIPYKDLHGKPRRAVLTLPYGFKAGQKVPVVVNSDVGYTHENSPELFELRTSSAWLGSVSWLGSMETSFAAAGYAYLWAEMPVYEMGDTEEAYRYNLLSFTDGILPAVEEVVRVGIADPQRVFLYGASSMGYGVYGLVTQTARFKAAIAQCAPMVDRTLDVLYRPSTPIRRYTDSPHDQIFTGATREGLPFWRAGDFLRRHSPMQYVDRVQTPLMIIHGDLDLVPIINAELFFGALVQQRKPAELVRYWGEGHTIRTPANYRDWWQRMLAWFDRWGDIARDAEGSILFDAEGRVQSRNGASPLEPEDFAKFPMFGPGGGQGTTQGQTGEKRHTR